MEGLHLAKNNRRENLYLYLHLMKAVGKCRTAYHCGELDKVVMNGAHGLEPLQ